VNAFRAIIAAIVTSACGSTYHEAREFQGQVYYTERTAPDFGERMAHSVTHDCNGGVRDDDRALRLVPSSPTCPRSDFTVDYVPDGIHRVDACTDRWKIRCTKTSSTRSPTAVVNAPLECVVDCVVEDHFTSTQ
jgi:hypothetical protein